MNGAQHNCLEDSIQYCFSAALQFVVRTNSLIQAKVREI